MSTKCYDHVTTFFRTVFTLYININVLYIKCCSMRLYIGTLDAICRMYMKSV